MTLLPLLLLALSSCSIEAMLMKPKVDFADVTTPPAPDYADPDSWAAQPNTKDAADWLLPGASAVKAPPADVFFLHPTTFFRTDAFNETIAADSPSTELLLEVALAKSAPIFNTCCAVWAPRYRQATIGAFYADQADAHQAFSLAYSDVDRAFSEFLAQTGDRPFLIAGQSQGSLHAMRLLERVDADPALRKRFVAAYIPGAIHPESRFGTAYTALKACDSPEQVGCINAWDTYQAGASTRGTDTIWHWKNDTLERTPAEQPQCTNPVSWRDDGTATAAEHKGAVNVVSVGAQPSFMAITQATEPLGLETSGLQAPVPELFESACVQGFLHISDLSTTDYPPQETTRGNYHLMDFELFSVDIRENAVVRVGAWSKLNPPAVVEQSDETAVAPAQTGP